MEQLLFHFPIPGDEIPYSTVTRYALISGLPPAEVFARIYMNPRKRIHPYLPGLNEKFAKYFALEASEVVLNRTLFPLIAFAQPNEAENIKYALAKDSEVKALANCAITHTRIKFFYGLNYCPQCIAHDLEVHGFPYWHVLHQIPGVQACYIHHCLLISMPLGDGHRDRALVLPPMALPEVKESEKSQVTFAKFAADLMEFSRSYTIQYQVSYLHILQSRGLICSSGNTLKLSQIKSELAEYWAGLPFINTPVAGIPEALSDFAFIETILREKTHSYCHPVKHILLACWLTESDPQLLIVRSRMDLEDCCEHRCDDQPSESQIESLLQQRVSLNQIEKLTGASRCRIKRIAEWNLIPHRTNAMRTPPDVRRRVLIQALYGKHRSEIATEFGVSVGYVEQVISAEPKMSVWRKHLKVRKNLHAAYKQISKVVYEHPAWSRAKIREHAQNAFFRLYNHDKELLNRVLPKPQKPTPCSKNWKQEDESLLEVLSSQVDIKNNSLSSLDRQIGGHGRLLKSRLARLPKTRGFLIEAGILRDIKPN